MKIKNTFAILCASVAVSFSASAADFSGKKVLFIDSYHEGYPWSDGVTDGVKSVIEPSGAELKIFRMDTKRNGSEEFKVKAADAAKEEIKSFGPDVVIGSDDNASKYLIAKYFKDDSLPFVFCGVNWDASVYGFPYSNVTGMVEVMSLNELIDVLKASGAKGDRVALLTSDVETEHKDAENVKKTFGISFVAESYVSSFVDWKTAFTDLQGKADILFISNNAGINDWNDAEAAAFVEANATIPSGSVYDFMAPFVMITYAKVAQEQGAWAADAALKILGGTLPKDIAIAQNTEGKMILNARIIGKVNVEVPADIVTAADQVIE